MTVRTIVLPFQQIVRWFFAVALLVAGLSFLPALLSDVRFDSSFSQSTAGGDPGFNLTLPQRSLALQTTTGTVEDEGDPAPALPPPNPSGFAPGDQRLGQAIPGIAASLGAVFPFESSDGPGFAIYVIDPITGQGSFAFGVSAAAVNEALAWAVESGTTPLLGPEPFSGAPFYPRLYAMPSNECVLISLLPDGKEFQVMFDCAT